MITEDLIAELQKYKLSIVKKEKYYSLVDMDSGEWFENMTIHYIYTLLEEWKKHQKKYEKAEKHGIL